VYTSQKPNILQGTFISEITTMYHIPTSISLLLLLFMSSHILHVSFGKRIEFDATSCYQEPPGNSASVIGDFYSSHMTLSSSPVNADRPISIQIRSCRRENGFRVVTLKAQPNGYYFSKTNPVKLGRLLDTKVVCGLENNSQVKQ